MIAKEKLKGANPSQADRSSVFLTEQELSARWKRSVKTTQAERLRGSGVPYIKIGRLVRYRLSDVIAYEERQLRSSTTDWRVDVLCRASQPVGSHALRGNGKGCAKQQT